MRRGRSGSAGADTCSSTCDSMSPESNRLHMPDMGRRIVRARPAACAARNSLLGNKVAIPRQELGSGGL